MKTFMKHVGYAGLLGLAIASIWSWCVDPFTNKDILFIVFWVIAIPLTSFLIKKEHVLKLWQKIPWDSIFAVIFTIVLFAIGIAGMYFIGYALEHLFNLTNDEIENYRLMLGFIPSIIAILLAKIFYDICQMKRDKRKQLFRNIAIGAMYLVVVILAIVACIRFL